MSEDKKDLIKHAKAIAGQVLNFMTEHKVPAIPQNYLIFYLYFDVQSGWMREIVDREIATGRAWTEESTQRVFSHIFSAEANLKRHRLNEKVASNLQEVTQGILNQASASADVVHETSEKLSISLAEITGSAGSVRELAAWLMTILTEIRRVEEVSRGLGQEMQGKREELQDIMEALAEVEVLAMTDELTQVANRRAWEARLTEEFGRFRRYKTPCGVIMLDLDDFKQLNDTYGHIVGDLVLKEVAKIMTTALRTVDFPARYGGEEFGALLPETDLEGAVIVADRMRSWLAGSNFTVRGKAIPVTASLGVAVFGPEDRNGHQAVDRADQALYRAKAQGKNRVVSQAEA